MTVVNIHLPKLIIHKQKESPLFLHQEWTLKSLFNNDVVINDTHTGTGKTKASLLYLKELVKNKSFHSVMFISPVNMLVNQTTIDIIEFVKENNLPYLVFPIVSETLRKMRDEFKQRKDGTEYTNADILARLMEKPTSHLTTMIKIINQKSELHQSDTHNPDRPVIYVINPDIFSYMLVGEYYKTKRRDIHLNILQKISYLVIDEFHYYDFFQLSAFFILLCVWKEYGLFDRKNKKVCLLSATPNNYLYEVISRRIGLRVQTVNDEWCVAQEPDITQLESVDVLTPAILSLHSTNNQRNFFKKMTNPNIKTIVKSYIDKDKYGLIVCNSRRDVNKLYARWKRMFLNKIGRITGTIKEDKDRQKEMEHQLLLATNTVDIGFNFQRIQYPSERQNIDFIFADFFNYDELIQRIGRCGRVLGKKEKNVQSHIHLFLPLSTIQKVQKKVTDDMDRMEILELIKTHIPERKYYKNFFKEFGSFVAQLFLNRLRTYTATPKYYTPKTEEERYKFELQDKLRELLHQVFGTTSKREKGKTTSLVILSELFEKGIYEARQYSDLTPLQKRKIIADYIGNKHFRVIDKCIQYNGYEKLYNALSSCGESAERIWEMKNALIYDNDHSDEYTKNLYHCKAVDHKNINLYYYFLASVFSAVRNEFRGSGMIPSKRIYKDKYDTTKEIFLFNATDVEVYDPERYMGSTHFNADFFQVATRYEYRVIDDHPHYPVVELFGFKDEYVTLKFWLTVNGSKEEFESGIKYGDMKMRKCLWRLVIFPKETLHYKFEPTIDFSEIPTKIKTAMKSSSFIGYIIPEKMNVLNRVGFFAYSYPLEITFNNNGQTQKGNYQIVFGKDGLLLSSAMRELLGKKK